jgi:uncharacterized protein (DUF885 family)
MRVTLLCFIVLLSPVLARADDLRTLARDYWAWRTVHQPMSGDDVPRVARPPAWAPDFAPATVAAVLSDLARFEARWRALANPRAPVAEQVDYRLLGSALARVRWEIEVVRSWRRNPGFYVDQTLGALVDELLPSRPWTKQRGEDVLARLHAFPRVLEDARSNLDETVSPFSRLALADLQDIGPRLRKAMGALRGELGEDQGGALDGETERAVAALESYREWLGASSGNERFAVGRDSYIAFLRTVALMPFSPEEILAMGRQEWARAKAFETLEHARNEGLPELPIFADQAQQIARARQDELAIRGFLEKKGILTVPAWMRHYGYRPLPAYLAPLTAFGEGTDFAPPDPLAEATRYIPKPSPDLGYFALSMARDPRADMVHEGIPGHGFQLALSWHQPDEIRRHWYDSGINEGLGFYCEEMMLGMGLFDDSPRTREMMWSYMRLRALRVELDVRLATGSFTIDDAARYLAESVPMDQATALGEAASFASTPGFAIGYEIGKLQIVDFLAEARGKQGAAFSLRRFHDFLFTNGNVPVSLQRWELLGEKDGVPGL